MFLNSPCMPPPVTDPDESHEIERANLSDPYTAQHIYSEKQIEFHSQKDKFLDVQVPPGCEEEVNFIQQDSLCGNIFLTQTWSDTIDCYSCDTNAFRINSKFKRKVAIDNTAPYEQIVTKTFKVSPKENLENVPEIVYNEKTLSENDFFTKEIVPGYSLVSFEETELLEILSCKENTEDDESSSKDGSKSAVKIVEEDSKLIANSNKSNVHLNVRQRAPTPKYFTLSQELSGHLEVISKFPKNRKDHHDCSRSTTRVGKKRMRCNKHARVESRPQSRKKSPIGRLRMSQKVETGRITDVAIDELETKPWNQKSSISNASNECDSSSDMDDTVSLEIMRSDDRTKIITTPTATGNPSVAFSKNLRKNGSTMDLLLFPCCTSTVKQPPFRESQKRIPHKPLFRPLHPVSDDLDSSIVYIHLEPDPSIERDTEDSSIKVTHKSLQAFKVSKNFNRLFGRYCRVSVDHVWKNTKLEWEKIHDASKRLLWEMMPKQLHKINYEDRALGILNNPIFLIEQSVTDISGSSTFVNSNLDLGNASASINLSKEMVYTESKELCSAESVQLHESPISPSMLISNSISELSSIFNVDKQNTSQMLAMQSFNFETDILKSEVYDIQQKPIEDARNKKVADYEACTADSNREAAIVNIRSKHKLLPMPVPQTFNFETNCLKQEVYNVKIECGKVDNCENDAEFETRLPLKKRKRWISVPSTPSFFEDINFNEISYPATPMLSIADLYIPIGLRSLKTAAEKKQLPADPVPVPMRRDPPTTPLRPPAV